VAIVGGGTAVSYTPNANFFGSNVFTYTISDGNGGSDTASVAVTATSVSASTDGKVTGGGSINKKSQDFSFTVQGNIRSGVLSFSGNLNFQDKSKSYRFDATSIDFLRIEPDGVHARFAGSGKLNGASGYSFEVTIEDRLEPGIGADKFRIKISGLVGFSYDSDRSSTSGGLLESGNIQVHKPSGNALVARHANTAAAEAIHAASSGIEPGEVRVSIGQGIPETQAATIRDAIKQLNSAVAPLGLSLVEVYGSQQANLYVQVAVSSLCGGLADGILGCATDSGEITIIDGWNWYTGSDQASIAHDQYDFETVVIHELGHGVGFEHTSDVASAMHSNLRPGVAHRSLVSHDLAEFGGHVQPESHEADAPPIGTPPIVETGQATPVEVDFALPVESNSLVDPALGSHSPHNPSHILVAGDGDDLVVRSRGRDVLVGGVRVRPEVSFGATTRGGGQTMGNDLVDVILADVIGQLGARTL
jgi:hypothetical protein